MEGHQLIQPELNDLDRVDPRPEDAGSLPPDMEMTRDLISTACMAGRFPLRRV